MRRLELMKNIKKLRRNSHSSFEHEITHFKEMPYKFVTF